MNQKIYFDNNATTKCDEDVLNAMLPYLKDEFGNPSSTYSFGKKMVKMSLIYQLIVKVKLI